MKTAYIFRVFVFVVAMLVAGNSVAMDSSFNKLKTAMEEYAEAVKTLKELELNNKLIENSNIVADVFIDSFLKDDIDKLNTACRSVENTLEKFLVETDNSSVLGYKLGYKLSTIWVSLTDSAIDNMFEIKGKGANYERKMYLVKKYNESYREFKSLFAKAIVSK